MSERSQLLATEQAPGTTRTLLSGADGAGEVRRTIVPGGLRVITEAVPSVRSAAIGIWVGIGSRDEEPMRRGATHFLEHLLFKGTKRRSALEIAATMDAVGGESNAFTAKEFTCYYARVLDDDLPIAVDVVSDMVTSALLAERDVEAERGVILEEIAMHDDDPADAVHDEFAAALFGDTPLGRPVLGTSDSISSLTRDQIASYYRDRYRPQDTVVAVSGNIDHDAVIDLVGRAFDPVLVDRVARPVPPRLDGPGIEPDGRAVLTSRRTEQANLILGTLGVPRTDERRFSLAVLNAALGGGMSSRLFQEVRERRGLAYSVFSFASGYADTGQFGVYVGCQPAKADEVLAICRDELRDVLAHGITEEELERGKGQMRGGFVLGQEDTGSRMSRIGKSELVLDELLSLDEVIARVDAVTVDDVRAVAREVLDAPLTLSVVGPFDEGHDFSWAVAR
ncbi:MAG: M16 family metallopeptidase [Streptosporangiaceae bacterium]